MLEKNQATVDKHHQYRNRIDFGLLTVIVFVHGFGVSSLYTYGHLIKLIAPFQLPENGTRNVHELIIYSVKQMSIEARSTGAVAK